MEKNKFSPHILVIDDERDIREGCERILHKMGCRVFSADNGKDGLDILANEKIHLVICDIKMPGMDGIEVLEKIKERDDSVLVVMITGFSTVETAITAMKKGAYDFISKPFTLDQMRLVMKRAIEKIWIKAEARHLKSEHQQSLADLGAEKSRLRTIVESLPNGVLVTDMTGHIVLMNHMAKSLLALPQDMKSGELIETCIVDEGLRAYLMKASQCAIDDQNGLVPYEMVLSEERYVLVQGRPVTSETGDCLGAVVELSDITAMKLFDRLKSEFVTKVSHELRSPLSIIHEQLAMVLKAGGKDVSEEDQHILGRAKEKTNTLISLIGDLLDICKIEAGAESQKAVQVHVDDLIEQIVDFLSIDIKKKGHVLEFQTSEAPIPPVVADPIALESIFGNLITNAIKYTPDKGFILIRVDHYSGRVRVRIKDNGLGIQERHQKRIFEKFYRVKDDKTRYINGTGLGLSIVKALVDTLGGQITLTSQPGKGSEFTLMLPITGI